MTLDAVKLRAALERKTLEDPDNPEAAAIIREAIDTLVDDLLTDISKIDGIDQLEPDAIVEFLYQQIAESLTQ